MTVASEIQRIKTNISDAYSACDEKGATLPTIQNSANLADCIESISGGGDDGISIKREVSPTGAYRIPTDLPSTFTLPSNVTDVSSNALKYAYSSTSAIEEVDLHNLTKISGSYALQGCFSDCDNLESVDLSGLTTISGYGALNSAFQGDDRLTSFDISNLTTLSGTQAFTYAFSDCYSLESIEFPKLNSLTGSNCFMYAFRGCSNVSLYFPALTNNSFGSSTYQFNYMFYDAYDCTVHFPIEIKKKIASWSDVTNGFGGYGTTILFDLNVATLQFNVTPSNSTIYIDGETISTTTLGVAPENTPYLIYDSSSNTILKGTATGLASNTTTTVNANLTQNAKKITLSVGISGLDVTFTVDGHNFNATAESSGKYSINVVGSGFNVSYFVSGGNNYKDASGTIATTGNAITQNITLSAATVKTFTRPNLTANGTMGGDSFAISAECSTIMNPAYKAVDGSTSSELWLSPNSGELPKIILYNPKPLKITTLNLTYPSTTWTANSITVQGSNDNSSWQEISTHSTSSTNQTINPNSTKFFKYHRLVFGSRSFRVLEIVITAQYKE